jgi:hypothetical protein
MKPIKNRRGAMIISIIPIHLISINISSLRMAKPELKKTIKVLKYARKVLSLASLVLSIASLSVKERIIFSITSSFP